MAKKTNKEITAQLSLIRWLMNQPNLKTALDVAHKLLTDLQFDGDKIAIKDEEIYTADFLEFWVLYPKKVGKGDAFRKWTQLITSKKQKELVIHSIEQHKRSEKWKGDEGKYIPNPATFLHQRRFDDTPEIAEEKKVEVQKQREEIKKCKHGYPLYVECPDCKTAKNG